ncbi:hypothetical protein I3760_02G134200 [Carya illinoinensis]|nr:hypothetical protein I3760_02G134200 [Carya illinoinensis]
MATATMATAAGAAALLYYSLKQKLPSNRSHGDDEDEGNGSDAINDALLGIDRVSHRLIQAPGTWLETISTLSETLRFTYSETLGKWPIGDLAFGISFLLKRQGNLHVGSVFGGEDSLLLKGPDITAELRYLLNLLTLCWHFSKKPFPLFLEETGYSKESVLLHEPKAGIVGHSLGGGTAALLTYILREQKDFSSTTCVTFAPAACMTWELAESGNDFITSVINGADLVPTFSAAAFDDLRAEVTASAWINDLRNQIGRTRILSTVYRSASALGSRLPSVASATAKVAGAGAILRPVSNGTQVVMKRAQSMAQAAWTRPALSFSSWSCMGPRRRATVTHTNSNGEGSSPESSATNIEGSSPESSATNIEASEHFLLPTEKTTTTTTAAFECPVSSSIGMEWTAESELSHPDEIYPDAYGDADLSNGEDVIGHNSHEDCITEVELWQQLEHELYDRPKGQEADVAKEILEEAAAAIAEVVGEDQPGNSTREIKEAHRFFPPGRIMHIVTLHSDGAACESDGGPTASSSDNGKVEETKVGIFLTQRSLYSKLRLSQTMINDHFMPVYRRQIERLIKDFEKEEGVDHKTGEVL